MAPSRKSQRTARVHSGAFAHPRKLPPEKTGAPRIAIIVGGLGISATGTADALAKLPAPVTLAIAPYGNDLDKLAESARAAQDHEVLLQSPMEPFDYPDNDPGPETLLTSLTADQNIDRLHWQMSRLQGYVGIVSYMGARFTSSEPSLAPVLRETAKRGLIYVDDGSSPRSIAGQLAGSHNFPFAKTDVVIIPCRRRSRSTARSRGSSWRRANTEPRSGSPPRCRRPWRASPMGESSGGARLRAGSDHHGGGEGKVVIVSFTGAK